MKLFSPPSLDDIIHLLRAWKFWVLGAILGAVIGAAVYFIVPPPYQARATVLVDFNLEEAWPQETDRQQFYYLERETRKLEEIAWSDYVIAQVAGSAESMESMRNDVLQLSQPAEGGWHFYAENRNPVRAQLWASEWAQEFTERAQQKIETGELNPYIHLEITQSAELPVERSAPLSTYLLIGAIGFLTLSAFVILFFSKPK